MSTFDVLHARDDAGQRRVSVPEWLQQDAVDANVERRQKLLEQPPGVQVEAGRILVPSVLAGNGRFNDPRRISIQIAGNEVLRSFCGVGVGASLR